MTFRKIPLTFLILTMGVTCAHAKKEPKYEQARQLTADQAALVQKAIASGEGAHQEHPAAHAAGGNLHPGHAAGREAV